MSGRCVRGAGNPHGHRPVRRAVGLLCLMVTGGILAACSVGGWDLAQPDPRWVPDVRVERIAEAGHWVQAEASERVNELLLAFLR